MSWKAIKKRIRSKTYHVASVMLSIGVTVETYSPEIKQVVADKIGISWGIAYAVMFALSMQFMREITKEPISAKGEKDVELAESGKTGEQLCNCDDDGCDSCYGGDSGVQECTDRNAQKGCGVVQGQGTGKRIADPRTKHRVRTKRRR